jgi:dihydroxy-acid dehydratase
MHLIAMAHAVDIEITLKDFKILVIKRHFGRFKTKWKILNGRFTKWVVYQGNEIFVKEGLLHGNCLTVTGFS